MEYDNLFRSLFENKIRYLICGGLAVNLYGVNRMTADIDLLLDLTEANLDSFYKTIRKLNYFPVLPLPMNLPANKIKRLDLIDKNLIAYSFYNSQKGFMNIDIIIDIPRAFGELWNRRQTRQVDDFSINILSLEDLIDLKEFVNRDQDKNDILMLRKLQNERKK